MKKTLLVATMAVALVGCKTSGKLFDAAHVAAEAAPAIIEDGRSLTDKLGDAWAKIRSFFGPSTNAPVVVIQ